MSRDAVLVVVATFAVFVVMLAELVISKRNERALRARGASEPLDDVYRAMSWSYPAAFVAMAAEAWLIGPSAPAMTIAGAVCFVIAKAVKYWAMLSLGSRWSFRVLVLPGAPLVTTGPYAWLRHPNYVGVIGELAGFALLVGAPITGVVSAGGFALLLRARIRVEERALGIG
jgi:methyltransferase